MKRKLLIASMICFFVAGLAAYGLCSSETTNLGLTKPAKGDRNWGATVNTNMDLLDAAYGNYVTTADDLPQVYVYSDTFNSSTGRTITLPNEVDAITEYSVTVTPATRAGAIGDIYVTKTTTNFVVKCFEANTTDTFAAVVYYTGDSSQYGGSIYRRWYVSPASSITDHANVSTTGSIAWVQAQISTSPAIMELPGNKTYQIKNNLTLNDNLQIARQMGAIIDTDFSILDGNYEWYKNGATSEYYLQATGGGNPNINMPSVVIENNARMTDGAAGSLAAGEWDWNDVNGLGYSTVYVRLSDSTDPDTKSADYVEAGYTLTINGLFDKAMHQAFSGAGIVVFGVGAVSEVYACWWGENTTPGTTDMTAELQAAITAGSAIKAPLMLAGDTYLTTDLNLITNSKIYGPGKLDGTSGMTSAILFAATPSPVFEGTLDSNAAVSAKTVAITGSGASVGDIIVIASNTKLDGTAGISGTDYTKGEQALIKAVSGATLTIDRPLWFAHPLTDIPGNGVKIYTPHKDIEVKNVEIEITPDAGITFCADFYYCYNLTFENNKLVGAGTNAASPYHMGAIFTQCHKLKVKNNTVSDFSDGVGYGLSGAGNDMLFEGNIVEGCKHNINIGGLPYCSFNNTIADNVLTKVTSTSPLCVHNGCLNWTVENNIIEGISTATGVGMIWIRSGYGSVIGNQIKGSDIGIHVSFDNIAKKENLLISSNNMVMVDGASSWCEGIRLDSDVAGTYYKIDISNNMIDLTGSAYHAGGYGIGIRRPAEGLILKNNTIIEASAFGLWFEGTISGAIITDNLMLGGNVTGNGYGAAISLATGTSEDMIIARNVITDNGTTVTYHAGLFRLPSTPTLTRVKIFDNIYKTNGSYQFAWNEGAHNSIAGQATWTGYPKTGRAAVVPTTGTWEAGDVVWNSTPSASNPPGWICVTGGTPGTWKAMANLAS